MRKSLTKKQIIRSKTDIDNLFKAGKKYSSSCFKLLVRQNNLPYSRMIVIPVRHFGNSVRRNKIRRQLKEIWRLNQDRILPGLDCAFIVYSDSDLSYGEKEEILINLLNKSGSLKG
ncbi:MAG: ribonuclease P protein component [Sphaerochaetaceae bacterium]|nr:ribonuclease P protein component [Sphaerochaetaceae bacterium]